MAQERLLDVWLKDLNEVYSGVPFTVVADWLQQGRLLAEDRVRMAGNQKWHTIAAVPALAPYLPRAEPLQVQDQAEALEPVELGLDWRRPSEDEDEDVDMIPLIDISLVLLIFFMMTATVSSGVLSPIDTPAARHQLEAIANDTYWVGIQLSSRGGKIEPDAQGRPLPWYSLGLDKNELEEPKLELQEIMTKLGKQFEKEEGEITVRVRAEKKAPFEVIRDVTLDLQGLEKQLNSKREQSKRLKLNVLGEVSEPKEP